MTTTTAQSRRVDRVYRCLIAEDFAGLADELYAATLVAALHDGDASLTASTDDAQLIGDGIRVLGMVGGNLPPEIRKLCIRMALNADFCDSIEQLTAG